jgi:predicted RNA binding protein YcfA (HicA-like mRNA interferase family)
MSRLPRQTGKEIVRALAAAGFEIARAKGSHQFRDCEMSPEEFEALL